MPSTSIAPYIDATGIHVPTYAEIRAWLVANYQTIFGADVYLGNDSQDGQFLSIEALALSDWCSDLVAAYNSFSPATAQGAGLSSVVKINGLQRAIPTQSTVDLDIGGHANTTITNGIVQDINKNKWNLPASVVIPNTGTITVTATAQEAGAIIAAAGTVEQIITPTLGWQTATNPTVAVPGSPVETDATLRRRQSIASGLPAVGPVGTILAGLGQVTGVTEVVIHENATDTTDAAGVPEHSIAVVIVGGNVDDIAQMIALKKAPGCNTFGDISIVTLDTSGIPITINFSRPTDVIVPVALNVTALAGYSTTVTTEQQTQIAAYLDGLAIGEGLYFNRLWVPANLAGSPNATTFEINTMTADGGTADIPVAWNEQIVAGTVTVVVV